MKPVITTVVATPEGTDSLASCHIAIGVSTRRR